MAEHKIIDEVFKEDKSLAQRVQDAIRMLMLNMLHLVDGISQSNMLKQKEVPLIGCFLWT